MDFIKNLKNIEREIRIDINKLESNNWNKDYSIEKALLLMNKISTVKQVIIPLTYGTSKNKDVDEIYNLLTNAWVVVNHIFNNLMDENV